MGKLGGFSSSNASEKVLQKYQIKDEQIMDVAFLEDKKKYILRK